METNYVKPRNVLANLRASCKSSMAMTATTNGSSKRLELAAFLRDRRARLAPSEVGLPDGPRRRTPGLRREEVAQLAEVGASWYTWLEQGRDIHVSEAFLERLSRALRLDPAERSHLFGLARGRSPRGAVMLTDEVSERLKRTIDAHPQPAVVSTTLGDVVAMNEPARLLWGDRRGTNSLWTAFTQSASSCGTPEWERHARNMVARFRVEAARAADRAPFDQLVEELSEISAEFRAMWASQEIVAEPEGAKIVEHEEVGAIELDHVALMHVEPDGRTLRVTFYAPRAGESAERAARLFGAKP
jgi:transcriptional regulator with XRE-family HTH domain